MLCLTEIMKAKILNSLMTVNQSSREIVDYHKNLITNCFEKMGTRPLFFRLVFPEFLNANLYDEFILFGRNL